MFPAHGRAFQVPAGPASSTVGAPRALPAGQVGLRRLPQHEVGGVLLVGRHLDAGAGDDGVAVVARQAAVSVPRADLEQHMAISFVGVAGLEQPLDHGGHLGDVVGGPGLHIGVQVAQRRHIGVEGPGGALGDRPDVFARLFGPGVDLVVHVGDVADVGDSFWRRVETSQQPRQHVEHHHRPGIANMGVVVDRRAAHVHADMGLIQGLEVLLGAGQGVVKAEGDVGHGGLCGQGLVGQGLGVKRLVIG